MKPNVGAHSHHGGGNAGVAAAQTGRRGDSAAVLFDGNNMALVWFDRPATSWSQAGTCLQRVQLCACMMLP
jgi:hypothetical protein